MDLFIMDTGLLVITGNIKIYFIFQREFLILFRKILTICIAIFLQRAQILIQVKKNGFTKIGVDNFDDF